MADFTIKKGDTRPILAAVLKDNDVVIDLTLATAVKFIMKSQGSPGGAAAVNAACEFISKPAGTISYTWVLADTATSGLYNAEFEITWTDGGKQTVPNDTIAANNVPYYVIEIKDDLG